VIRLLHDQLAFSDLLLHHLLSRNIRIEEDLVDQLFNSRRFLPPFPGRRKGVQKRLFDGR